MRKRHLCYQYKAPNFENRLEKVLRFEKKIDRYSNKSNLLSKYIGWREKIRLDRIMSQWLSIQDKICIHRIRTDFEMISPLLWNFFRQVVWYLMNRSPRTLDMGAGRTLSFSCHLMPCQLHVKRIMTPNVHYPKPFLIKDSLFAEKWFFKKLLF